MANIPSTARDYTLNIPASRIHMAGTVSSTALSIPVLSPTIGMTVIPTPKLENWGSSGGGGGVATYSTPITG